MIRSSLLTLLLFALLGLVASCASAGLPIAAASGAPSSCHARGTGEMVLPDAACTPGATNPAVAQDTIAQTICRRGWTRTMRPPARYTDALKRQQMAAYGASGSPTRYEEDHLLSGGRVPLPVPASSPGVSGMPLADVVPRMG